MRRKFSALQVDFSFLISDPLGSRSPSYGGLNFGCFLEMLVICDILYLFYFILYILYICVICIFCQNPHIACFSAYNGIFRIAYAKIMPHMQKFAYMPHISAYAIAFSAFSLSNVVLRLLNILAANDSGVCN